MSDSEEEDFVKFGTPLEPLDEDCAPRKKPFSLEDQVVKDKHGRRRFHGAFTGGFSAGFFNSVGSLEGWKPEQFKSSRTAKAGSRLQKAEDFMDDEDMEEFGIAPKVLRATAEYDGAKKNERKRQVVIPTDGPIPGEPVLKNILEPVRETIGVKILIKMGWKPGQGVGPRVSKIEKKSAKKLYGCNLPDQETKSDASDDDSDYGCTPENITFAPDDYEPYIVKPKDNYFGLGYTGLDRRPVLSSHISLFEPSSLVMQDKKKKVSIRGQAFGVGAFEEEDEDIYAKDDMSQYDFALDTPSMLAERRKQEKESKQRKTLALTPAGKEVLEGFVLASNATVRKKFYPPPQLPQGFVPQHIVKPSRFEPSTSQMDVRNQVSFQTPLTALDRTAIVNEAVSPTVSQDSSCTIETTVESIGKTSTDFKPFKIDTGKQERYEKFLTLAKLGQTDRLESLQPLNMTEWERKQEKSEFEQASKIFRPLTADMSDRFVTAALADDDMPLLSLPKRKWSQSDVSNDMVEAAKKNMYGRLTRAVEDWYPCGVLCKLFNVPDPHSGTSLSQKNQKTSRPKFSVFNFLEAAPYNVHASASIMDSKTVDVPPPNVFEEPQVPDVCEFKDTKPSDDKIVSALEFEDPPNKEDLFKAIFLSSSDESDSEEPQSKGTSDKNNQPESTKVVAETAPEKINVLRNTSPPRGIFANLDLDAINARKRKVESELKSDENKEREENVNKFEESLTVDDDLTYGPCLPASRTVQVHKLSAVVDVNSSDDEWTSDDEKSEKRHKHKKKHKKKYKKEKKRKDHKTHKHKKKN